ncbi:MAG: PQQ-like beta-propeller repeat protein, partial [Verrucomicrobia bacterium]|nr:PQQ-like beta-propeller repeat protein [Verrucomicrobiota bacterium]
ITDDRVRCWTLLIGLDWDQYRSNIHRSAFLNEDIPGQWKAVWKYQSPVPPSAAWPAPAPRSYWQNLTNITARITEDQIFHPIFGRKAVYWGSSSENVVRALDLTSGALLWEYFCEAPVRYAPVFIDGIGVAFVADDGYARLVHSESGGLIWKKHLGPDVSMIPGNGRMISAWPLRSGLMYQDGRLYATCGIFPSQGVWLECMDAASGATHFRKQLTISPHGYLLSSGNHLFMPTGRGTPVRLNLDGQGGIAEIPTLPGTFAVVDDGDFLAGPGNSGQIEWSRSDSGSQRLARFNGEHIALTHQYTVLADGPEIQCLDRLRHRQISSQINAVNAQISALKRTPATADQQNELSLLGLRLDKLKSELPECESWKVSSRLVQSLALARNFVVSGHATGIEIRNIQDGSLVDHIPLGEPIVSLALDRECLVAVSQVGNIFGLHPASAGGERVKSSHEDRFDNPTSTMDPTSGFGLILAMGDNSTEIQQMLSSIGENNFQWIIAAPSRQQLVRWREAVQSTPWIGRVAFHETDFQGDHPFPWPDGFANLVLPDELMKKHIQANRELDREISRLCHPWRYRGFIPEYMNPSRSMAGAWTHQFGNSGSTSHSGDEQFSLPLRLQWFGGPGPATMVDRHLRGPAPLAADGVMIVPGENQFIAVDALNGQTLWHRTFPGSQRYTMPFDAGYYCLVDGQFILADGDSCRFMDAVSGDDLAAYPIPGSISSGPGQYHWGYIHVNEATLIGSIQMAKASRMDPSRELINDDYGNNQPLVMSFALVGLAVDKKQVNGPIHPRSSEWLVQSIGSIPNPAICADASAIYFIESEFTALQGRGLLSEFFSQPSQLTAVDIHSGHRIWSVPIPPSLAELTNSVFLATQDDHLIVTGSLTQDNDSLYRIACFDVSNGVLRWEAQHFKGQKGAFSHGEQVHHPVFIDNKLVTEPVLYDLESGRVILSMNDVNSPWQLSRPGHSCGTLTAAGQTLFFRAGNPTAMDLSQNLANPKSGMIKLAPTRPGCWINMIPACGLLLIPEASSGCVCHFSLQTSMAFRPGLPHSGWPGSAPN